MASDVVERHRSHDQDERTKRSCERFILKEFLYLKKNRNTEKREKEKQKIII